MYLDQRGFRILKELASNPAVTGKELEKSLHLTRKQLSYSFDKINGYLKDGGHEEIKRLKTGRFVVPSSVIQEYFSGAGEKEPGRAAYTRSDEERMFWIELRLLCHEEELSIYHFTAELQISKNTLMNDLKKIQERLEAWDLTLSYNRREGYHLSGREYTKRALLIPVLRRVLDMPGGEAGLKKNYRLREEELDGLCGDIEEIEQKLGVRFTDERVKELPYILYFILFRIRQGRVLSDLPEACKLVAGTQEYTVMAAFARKHGIEEELEKIFFTVQIQISNLHSLKEEGGKSRGLMLEAALSMIYRFEAISCVKIKGKEELLEALLQHLRPAFCRIRYHYHVQPDILDMVLPKYQYLHEIVKKAVVPLEELLSQEIPDRELVYITILIGTWLQKEGTLDKIRSRKRAVVVCTNGITVSNYIYIGLKELFPEIEFTDCLSERGFYEYREDFQLVFSTVRLKTDKPQFLVTPFFNDDKKLALRRKVLRGIGGYEADEVDTGRLMEIIEKYAKVEEKEQLARSLNQYFNRPEPAPERVSLKTLLTPQNIKIWTESLPWEEAIRLAAHPLVEAGAIERRYVDRMVEQIERERPYIMLGDGVIAAHAGIEDGVRAVGMSLLRLPERISINGYMSADLIIVLATPDKTGHLTALYGLISLLDRQEAMDRLRLARDEEEMADIIEKNSAGLFAD